MIGRIVFGSNNFRSPNPYLTGLWRGLGDGAPEPPVLRTGVPISNAVAAVRNDWQFRVVYPASGVTVGGRPSCVWTRGEYFGRLEKRRQV